MKIRMKGGILIDATYYDDVSVMTKELGQVSMTEFDFVDWDNSIVRLKMLRPGEPLHLNLTLSEVRLMWETELPESHHEEYELITQKSDDGCVAYIEPWRDGAFRETVIFCSIIVGIIGVVSWLTI